MSPPLRDVQYQSILWHALRDGRFRRWRPIVRTVQPGADADLMVFAPNYNSVISARTQAMNVNYSGFEGGPIKGRLRAVTVRAKVAVRDEKFVGGSGRDKLLKCTPERF